MRASLPKKTPRTIKAVIAQGSQTTANGNSAVPNAGYKIAGVPMTVPPRARAWFPSWHPEHPANQI